MTRKNGVSIAGLFMLFTGTLNAGFYAGAGLGSDTIGVKESSRVFSPGGFDVLNKADLSATGVFGSLFAGYGGLHNKFYLAAEANANISSTSFSGSNQEFVHTSFSKTTIKMQNSLGISVLPGYQFTPNTLFYGRLGLTNSKIQVATSDISLANLSIRRNGFRYGLGIKQAITERVALRMDYSRINYSSFQSGTFDPVGGVTKSTKRIPTQQLVEFGLVINFA